MSEKPTISLFFPTFNEEANISTSVHEAERVLSELASDYEIIVVDDGSSDATPMIVEALSRWNDKIKLVQHPRNLGYGAALQTGIASARMDYVFFTDADLQFDLEDLELLLMHVPERKVVIGSYIDRKVSAMRKFNSLGWYVLNRLVFGLKVRDIDCAFKLFERKTVQSLNLRSCGAMVSAEMLIRLMHKDVEWEIVPVQHLPRTAGVATGAKLSVIKKALGELSELYWTELGTSWPARFFRYASLKVPVYYDYMLQKRWFRQIVQP